MVRKRMHNKAKSKKTNRAIKTARAVARLVKGASRQMPMDIGYRTSGFSKPVEKKVLDNVLPNTTLFPAVTVATGLINLLNGISQGDDINQRDGRKFKMDYLFYRLNVSNQATTGAEAENYRLVIVYDRQPNNVIATSANIFTPDQFSGLVNLDNRARFLILHDMMFRITRSGVASQFNTFFKKKKINLKGLEVVNSGTGNTIGSISSGALLVCTYRTTGTTTTNLSGECAFRLRWKEI